MRRTTLLAFAALFLVGCDSEPATKPRVLTGVRHTWNGTFDNGVGGTGDIVLDLNETGTAIRGEIVYGPPSTYAKVVGSVVGDSIFLELDPAWTSATGFSLRARGTASGDLSGTMTRASQGLTAVVTCHALAVRDLTTDATHGVSQSVIAMEYDGSDLWLSMAQGDYVRLHVDGSVRDTVLVERYPGYLWVSSTLLWDGSKMWGAYPVSIGFPGGGVQNVADLLAFDEGGRTGDSLRVDHRPGGLAFDGASKWSLGGARKMLYRLGASGNVADSTVAGVPDASHLAYDGVNFWTTGWYLRRLYKLDSNGIVAMYDLPSGATGGFSSGLAVEGSHIWYAYGSIGPSTLLRMTPAP
jgi:hypothetical protein